MIPKKNRAETSIREATKQQMREMCERMGGISEAEYIRGAIELRLKKDLKKFRSSHTDG
jgi:hypothetical protein